MSLQIWLPLNGNLNNQGLDGTTSGAKASDSTFIANGKIGQCLFHKTGAASSTTFSSLSGAKKWSIALWYKIPADTQASGGNYAYFFTVGANVDGVAGNIRIEHTATRPCTQSLIPRNTASGFSTGYVGHSGYNTNNNWTHEVLTFDGDNLRIYYNGVLTSTTPKSSIYTTSYELNGKVVIGAATAYCCLNDFRIYDHCLSAKEVKEIAKGLCLHYKLDNNGCGSPNLSTLASRTPSLPNAAGTSIFSTTTVDGATRLTCTTAGSGGRYNTCFANAARTSNTTYTWSADVRASKNISVNIGLEGGSNKYFTVTTNWQRISNTAVLATDTYSAFIVYPYENASVNDWVEIKNIKVEVGSVATPWCPCSADTEYSKLGFNSATEIDCSGYRYNGTKTGTINPTNDTIKYSSCYEFGNNGYITAGQANGKMPTDQITVACWAYLPNWNVSTGMRMLSCTEGGGWQLSINDTSGYLCAPLYIAGVGYKNCTYALSNISAGWHHCAFTFNGTSIIIYLDGKQVATTTFDKGTIGYNSTAPLLVSGEPSSSAYTGNSWLGKLSDMRVYATALSANDIKELYQTSASIDKNGNLYCGEVVEQ